MGSEKTAAFRQIALINPASRGGKTGRYSAKIVDSLKPYIDAFKTSQFPGQMYQLAKESHMYNRIISVGGDGTICEILRGMDRQNQQLVIIPAGTGNSIAKDLNIQSIPCSIRKIACEKHIIKKIDLLDVSFIDCNGNKSNWTASSMVSLGYPSRVVHYSNKSLKRLGKICYPLAALCLAGKKNNFLASIAYGNNSKEQKLLTGILIGNTRYSGSFEAFPEARLDDSAFQVLELTNDFWKQNLFNISLVTKLHCYQPVNSSTTDAITISLPEPQLLMIDGEIITEKVTELSVRNIPLGAQCCI